MVQFKLPPANGGGKWRLRADTNFPDSTEEPEFAFGHVYQVTARSLLLFKLA
jgi:glycogen operon protein